MSNPFRTISDAELETLMRGRLDGLIRGAVRRKPEVGQPQPAKESQSPQQSCDVHASQVVLTGDERAYLDSILAMPNLTITGRSDYLGLSSFTSNRIKKALLSKGFIEEFPMQRKRGIVKLVSLTQRGFAALGARPGKKRPENRSAAHWWCQEMRPRKSGLKVSRQLSR